MKAYLCIFLVGCLSLMTGAQDKKQTPPDLDDSLKAVRDRRAEIQQEINRVQGQRNRVKRDIRSVDADLTRVNGQLNYTSSRLDTSVGRRDQLASELEIASAKMTEYKTRVENRLRQIYRTPDHSVLTLLVGADSVGDFAERKTLLERIAKRDRDLFEGLKELRVEIAEKKREQEQLIAGISELKEQHEVKQGELQEVQDEKKQVLRNLTAQQRELEREFAEFDRQERLLKARIKTYQAGKSGTPEALSFGGSMIKPANGPITSSFGMRYHPILKRKRAHNGLDIGAKNRSPISAAASGKVITAGWINGYGNTVVIDHGDGVSTLYGHCSVIHVREGQTVTMGDKIASVGSTGLATGPHLHFEVRIRGKAVNPKKYLP